ncbi:MAG: iron-sulfur cluster assembly protein [Aigarchaeota archaeon]|nr:iron-sulfur cluster assembly protein [Candidatus Pelearchaeum maunauluense]
MAEKPKLEDIINALKNVYDPEIPVNIVDLGLLYDVQVRDDNSVYVKMTLTAPGCPIGAFITEQVKEAITTLVEGVKDVQVELTFDPPWTPDRMSEEAKAMLGFV